MPGATGTSDGLHLSHMVTIGETSLARYGSLEDSTPYLVWPQRLVVTKALWRREKYSQSSSWSQSLAGVCLRQASKTLDKWIAAFCDKPISLDDPMEEFLWGFKYCELLEAWLQEASQGHSNIRTEQLQPSIHHKDVTGSQICNRKTAILNMLELSGIELDCPVAYSGTNYHPSTFIYDNGNDNSHKSNENSNEMTWGDVLVISVRWCTFLIILPFSNGILMQD